MSAEAARPTTLARRPFTPSSLGLGLRWLGRSRAATFGGTVMAAIGLAAIFAPLLTSYAYDAQDFAIASLPPLASLAHPLGTDQFGRDILSRVLYGARVSLAVSLSGMLVASAVGVAAGLLSAYLGGALDAVLMRLADVQLSFPYLILAIAMMALLGPSLPLLVVVLAVRGWVNYARTIRGIVLSLKEEEFVAAAIVAGASPGRIILRHLLPNVLAPIIVLSSFELAAMMLTEASLSFLGLGVQPPMPSWGSMVSQGRDYIYTSWWLTTIPGLALMLAVLGANQLGDGLRDLLDPRLRGARL
ncbi:MAG: ABC transporter permease [Chloroflexi bacterium]|nr:ABC transporter permease [Chloroflexota bacterium]